MRLTWRDAVATALVGAAVVLYAGFLTGAGWPLVSGTRVLAAVVLGLGLAACVTGSRVLDMAAGGPAPPGARLFSFAGTIAFVSAVTAMITGSEALLAVLVGTVALMWLAATVLHLMTPTRPGRQAVAPGAHEGELAGRR